MRVAARAADRKYRKAKNKLILDQWRAKTWRVGIMAGGDRQAMDAVWMQRMIKYWNMQSRLYGFAHTSPSMHFTEVDGWPIVTSMVRVTEVLPGERVGRKEWVQWRLENPQVA